MELKPLLWILALPLYLLGLAFPLVLVCLSSPLLPLHRPLSIPPFSFSILDPGRQRRLIKADYRLKELVEYTRQSIARERAGGHTGQGSVSVEGLFSFCKVLLPWLSLLWLRSTEHKPLPGSFQKAGALISRERIVLYCTHK